MVARSDTVLYIESHRKWYVVALIVSIIAFASAAVEVHLHGITGWEQRLMLDINDRSSQWRAAAVVVSAVGGSVWTAVISVVFSYLFKLYRLSWRLALSFFVAIAVVYVAKRLVSQPEVLHLVPSLHVRVALSRFAFPSGSTTIATVIALSLLPYTMKFWRFTILPLWVVIIAMTRMYLGAQSPLDLIGGVALGTFLVSLIRIMPQNIRVALRLD